MSIIRIKKRIYDRLFLSNNEGMGVVEVILIILVLMGLVLLFKSRITNVIKTIFDKINSQLSGF